MKIYFFYLIVSLLIPFILLVVGIYFKRNKPKNINGICGYRTSRSMKNIETWRFAHQYCGDIWVKLGLISLPVTLLIMLLVINKDLEFVSIVETIIVLLQIILLFCSIVCTERALKREFDKDGNRVK